MKTALYYFSGTGNSLAAANILKNEIKGSDVLSISKLNKQKYDTANYEAIGFIFPVYLHTPPKQVKRFIKNMEITGNPYIFTVITINGEAGRCGAIIESLMKKKKQTLNYSAILEMPGNSIFLDGYTNPKKERDLRIKNSKPVLKAIADDIKKRKNKLFADSDSIRDTLKTKLMFWGLRNIIQPDKKFHTTEECVKCGTCKKVCPAKNIIIEEKVSWKNSCEYCLACIHWCPKKAIQIDKGTKSRLRYHHPEVSAADFIKAKT